MAKKSAKKHKKPTGEFVRELDRHAAKMKGFERRIRAIKDKGVLKLFEDGSVKAGLIAEREARHVSLVDELGIDDPRPSYGRVRRRLRKLIAVLKEIGITIRCTRSGTDRVLLNFFAR